MIVEIAHFRYFIWNDKFLVAVCLETSPIKNVIEILSRQAMRKENDMRSMSVDINISFILISAICSFVFSVKLNFSIN